MIKVGDRVIATEKIGGIFFTHVPQGTHGVVVEDQGGWFTRRYRVDFDNPRRRHAPSSRSPS